MTANEMTSGTALNTSGLRRGRAAITVLWIAQIALGAMFLMAGGSKLAGAPAMVSLFGALGLGQWFRYFTGAVEVSAALLLFIPRTAGFGALLLVATMLGAIAANLFLGQSPVAPLVLLSVASAIAWVRRAQVLDVI
jgi:uncharacterized membrane protein YphA (DoxX/SURF4 family)